MSLGGFTFKGVHSSTYGVRESPGNKVLSPRKRRFLTLIPGRSKAFVEEDGGYDAKTETITCSYEHSGETSIYAQVRAIAGWLDGIGELTFDYEPTMHYNAFLSSPPTTVTMLQFAQFQLEFTINPPFAYETPEQIHQLVALRTGGNNTIDVTLDGTADTPVRLIMTNNTDQIINRLKIWHKYVEGQ